MAIMAGEAITEGGTSGMRAASAKRARRGQQLRSRKVTRRTPIEGEIGGTQVETETYGPRSSGGGYASRYGQQARQVGTTAKLTGGRSSHQGAILAEFLLAMLIIIVAPIATGGHSTGLSPYAANDLKRIGAVGVVYFGLALVPGDNGSRVAAWLGGLVLLVLAMKAVNLGDLKAIVDIFSQGGTQPPGATTGSGGPNSPGVAPPPGAGAIPTPQPIQPPLP